MNEPIASSSRRRAVLGWSIYDLANTIFYLLVVSLYFPRRLAAAAGNERTLALAFFPAMLLAALLSPAFGLLLDRTGRARALTLAWTVLCVGGTAALAGAGSVAALCTIFGIAVFAYEMGCVSYNALLPSVATEATVGRVSGLGVALGYLGNVVALVVLDLLDVSEGAVFILAALLFTLFTVPLALWVPEAPAARPGKVDARELLAAVRGTFAQARRSLARPGLGRFLLGIFFVCDAVNTVLLQIGRFGTRPEGLGLSDEANQRFLIGVNVAAILGGLVLGRLADRTSGRAVTLASVVLLALGMLGAQLLPGFALRAGCMAVLGGAGLAGVWTASRHWLLQLVAPDEVGEACGLYGLMLRASVLSLFPFTALVDATMGYTASVLLLVALLLVGLVLLVRTPARRPWKAASASA